MNKMKARGQRIELCGTPIVTGAGAAYTLFTRQPVAEDSVTFNKKGEVDL